jgi:hypothetical protein
MAGRTGVEATVMRNRLKLARTRALRLMVRAIRMLIGGRGVDAETVRRQREALRAELILLDAYRNRDPHDPEAA